MYIRKLSLIIFLLPTFTITISYLLSLKLNYVPMCVPIIEGCTSISRTGRYFPVNIFFKSSLFLTGFLVLFYWYKNFIFFKKYKFTLMNYGFLLSIISTIFLFLYLIFLGESNYYKFFRKVGIFIYILSSIISELILSIIYYKNINKNKLFNIFFIKFKLYLSIIMIILAILLFPLMVMKINNISELRNIISWNYFLLIQINFLITFLIWKK